MTLSFLLLAGTARAHISMNPNYGAASGGYFQAHIKIPHGHHGLHTTKLVLHVPRGVASARPEVPAGWSVAVTNYDLAEEDRYVSHGNTVTTGPDKITWTADSPEAALYTDHLMNIGLQMKLLCSFNDPVGIGYSGSNSIWQGQHTLWFKMEQHSSPGGAISDTYDDIYYWTGALKDNDDGTSPTWNPPSETGLKACPYLFIHAGSSCSLDHSGEAVTGGMSWMGAYLPPTPNQGEVLHEQHVIDLATEAALSSYEALNEVDPLMARVAKLEDDSNTLNIAVAALALAATALGIIVLLCTFRITSKKQFAQSISGLPLVRELPTISDTKAEVVMNKA